MKVTVNVDEDMRRKEYWRTLPPGHKFEFVKDRPNGMVLLQDPRHDVRTLVSVQRDKVVFPD